MIVRRRMIGSLSITFTATANGKNEQYHSVIFFTLFIYEVKHVVIIINIPISLLQL